MKKHVYTQMLLCFAFGLTANAEDKDAKKDFGFAKHSAEVSVTPNAGYNIHNKGSEVAAPDKPYENRYPFMGFAFGAQYMYRPLALFAISAGLNMHMQALLWRTRTYPLLGDPYVSGRDIIHRGYLMLPIYFHLFKQMQRSTFEFAVGPDFHFPIFYRAAWRAFNSDGEKINSGRELDKFAAQQIRQNAVFGLSIFLGAQLYLCKTSDLFIGPQISFLNLAYFDKDLQKYRADYGGFIDIYLGLKLGFRLHAAAKNEASR